MKGYIYNFVIIISSFIFATYLNAVESNSTDNSAIYIEMLTIEKDVNDVPAKRNVTVALDEWSKNVTIEQVLMEPRLLNLVINLESTMCHICRVVLFRHLAQGSRSDKIKCPKCDTKFCFVCAFRYDNNRRNDYHSCGVSLSRKGLEDSTVEAFVVPWKSKKLTLDSSLDRVFVSWIERKFRIFFPNVFPLWTVDAASRVSRGLALRPGFWNSQILESVIQDQNIFNPEIVNRKLTKPLKDLIIHLFRFSLLLSSSAVKFIIVLFHFKDFLGSSSGDNNERQMGYMILLVTFINVTILIDMGIFCYDLGSSGDTISKFWFIYRSSLSRQRWLVLSAIRKNWDLLESSRFEIPAFTSYDDRFSDKIDNEIHLKSVKSFRGLFARVSKSRDMIVRVLSQNKYLIAYELLILSFYGIMIKILSLVPTK